MPNLTNERLKDFLDEDAITLDLSYQPVTDEIIFLVIEFIANYPQLKKISFYATGISDEGIKIFAEHNKTITTVDFSGNQISVTGIKDFAQYNKIATTVDWSRNGVDDEAIRVFAQHNEIVTTANFAENIIGDEGIKGFAQHNKVVTTVNFAGNAIRANGVKQFAQYNSAVTTVNFSRNRIDSIGVKEFAQYNEVVTTADFSINKIDNMGAKAFAQYNKVATTVCFRGNNIGDTGARKFAQYNKVATTVDFARCGISDSGVEYFAKYNTVATTISFKGNRIGEVGVTYFIEALKINYLLLSVEGLDNEEIKSYLTRNQRINDVFFLLSQSNGHGFNINPHVLDEQHNFLKGLAEFEQLSEDSYPKEMHRLVRIYRELHDDEPTGALASLLHPFKNVRLQKTADNLFAELFFNGYIECSFETTESLWRFALYCWKDKVHSSEMDFLLYRKFYNWINQLPIENFFIENQDSQKQILLLTPNDLSRLISQSYQWSTNPDEVELLDLLGRSNLNHPFIAAILKQLPGFISAFKEAYPDISAFGLPQYALFYNNPRDCRIVIEKASLISKAFIEDYTTQLSQLNLDELLEIKVASLKNGLISLIAPGEEAAPVDINNTDNLKTDAPDNSNYSINRCVETGNSGKQPSYGRFFSAFQKSDGQENVACCITKNIK